MKLLKEDYQRDGSGAVVLECEVPDDIWSLYNLVSIGDRLKGSTCRKVHRESASGSVSTETKRVTLEVCVKKTDYEGQGDILRVSGPVTEENPVVKVGAYHTLDIALHSRLTLYKENWDRLYVDALHTAADPHQNAELQVVLIESGLCQIFFVSSALVKRISRIQVNIPKHRGPQSNYDKVKGKFYSEALASLLLHTDFDQVKAILVAGPGFTKDDFLQFVFEEAARRDRRDFLSHREMFVLASASTAHRHALVEVLADPGVMARLENVKASRHAQKLGEFYRLLNASVATSGEKATNNVTCYGPTEVKIAADMGAVKTLLITDGLLRSSCGARRKTFVAITEKVKQAGGEVLILSDQHSSGEQLNVLSGIAAILLFPVADELLRGEEVE